jgi:hypothetical protein
MASKICGERYIIPCKIGINREQGFSTIGRYSMFQCSRSVGIGWLILGTCSITRDTWIDIPHGTSNSALGLTVEFCSSEKPQAYSDLTSATYRVLERIGSSHYAYEFYLTEHLEMLQPNSTA